MPRARPGRLALLGALALACSPDFTPRSVLVDLRVLALVASPLEAGPDDAVTVYARTLPPPGATLVDERWSFCPFTVGSSAAYACAVPACEVALTPDAAGRVSAVPGALARQCLAQLAAAGAIPPGVPAEVPARLDTLFRYVVTSSDGQTRENVQLLPLYPAGTPADRNLPPVVTAVQVGGVAVADGDTTPSLAPGTELTVRVLLDPASAQTYLDSAGQSVQESLVVSYYTTAGRFDYDRASGPDASVKLKYEAIDPTATEAQLWVVARDLRGGQTVRGPFRVPIAP